MDIEMAGLNGYETCQQIKLKNALLPIIFVTGHQSFEDHLKAYDAGGDDITTKPVDSKILLHKIKHAIRHKSDKDQLAHEAQSLRDIAMNFLSNAGESGVLIKFVHKAVVARSFKELAQYLVDAISELGEQCCVMLRHKDGQAIETSHGNPSDLEKSILGKMSDMGRLFQFKRQFIVNYNKVSIIITTDPQDSPEKIGRIRDHIAILAEIAESLIENVSTYIENMERTEQLQTTLLAAKESLEQNRTQHKKLLVDSRILLHELVDNVESALSQLNLMQSQESTISSIINRSFEKLCSLHTSD
jgi:AmiR/NasT family two-component response regulator